MWWGRVLSAACVPRGIKDKEKDFDVIGYWFTQCHSLIHTDVVYNVSY